MGPLERPSQRVARARGPGGPSSSVYSLGGPFPTGPALDAADGEVLGLPPGFPLDMRGITGVYQSGSEGPGVAPGEPGLLSRRARKREDFSDPRLKTPEPGGGPGTRGRGRGSRPDRGRETPPARRHGGTKPCAMNSFRRRRPQRSPISATASRHGGKRRGDRRPARSTP
jgi:hypothetical protein